MGSEPRWRSGSGRQGQYLSCRTCALVQKRCQDDDRVRGIDLLRNYGQHNALLCGIRAARHDIVVTIADDLQIPPEEIPKLVDKLEKRHDVVYGTPRREVRSLWRMHFRMMDRPTYAVREWNSQQATFARRERRPQ